MKTHPHQFEGIVGITKKEEIANVPSGKKFKILILESNSYPGYYAIADFPVETVSMKEKSLYLVLDKHHLCLNDCLMRKVQKTRNRIEQDLFMCPGEIEVYGKRHPCIRIRDADEQMLQRVIGELEHLGVEFHPFESIKKQMSFIFVRKFVELETIHQGIFKNRLTSNEFYFEIPDELQWDDFADITEEVKYNSNNLMFDAALATMIISHCRFMDCVRIFTEYFVLQNMIEIRKYYLKEFEAKTMI